MGPIGNVGTHPFVCAIGPISYLLHLLQTNSGALGSQPELPLFRTVQGCPKDSPTARRQAEDAVSCHQQSWSKCSSATELYGSRTRGGGGNARSPAFLMRVSNNGQGIFTWSLRTVASSTH